jgi:hypothetical protein
MWDVQCLVIGTQEAPYDRATLFGYYERHNAAIREHFRGREDFLEINIAEPDSYPRLCEFLEKPLGAGFPWLNRTPP